MIIMKKLNYLISQHLIICLSALVLLNPLIDITIGVGVLLTGKIIAIGIILRGIVLAVTLQYVVLELKPTWVKHWKWLLCGLISYIILHLLVIGLERGTVVAFMEIKSVIKFFYLPLMIYALTIIYLIKRQTVPVSAIAGAGVLYALFTLIPIATGTAINSYSYLDKAGFNGWFHSANEIGAILAIIYPIALIYFIKENRQTKIFRILMILTMIVSSLYIGTKVPFWGVMVTTISIGSITFIKAFANNFDKVGLALFCVAIVYAVNVFLPSTPIGENLGINKASYNVITGSSENTETLRTKKVLSGRNVKLTRAKNNFRKVSLFQKILGTGVTKGQSYEYSIEMDVFDIAFNFGILGTLLYFAPFLMVMGLIVQYRQGIAWAASIKFVAMILAIGLGFCASALAGHIMSAPAVSTYIAVLTVIMVKMALEPKRFLGKTNHVRVMNILQKVSHKNMTQTVKSLEKNINSAKNKLVVTANPETVMNYMYDCQFRDLINADEVLVIPDGIGVVKACNYINQPIAERVPGIELVEKLLKLADQRRLVVSSLGAKPDVVKRFKQILKKQYPGIQIGEIIDGYGDLDVSMKKIIEKQPHILLVALGVGKQEKIIYQYLGKLKGCIAIGVGGTIDVLSGKTQRAPQFFIKTNTEWLYRIIREPKRLGRFYRNNIKFALIALWLKLDAPKTVWWTQIM